MYQRILVPIDGSATADKGLEQAIALARVTGANIRLLHVVDELAFPLGYETGATYLHTVLPRLREASERILTAGRQRATAGGVSADTRSVGCFGKRTSDVIIGQAREWSADLIVIGTHGRRGMHRLFLGSDAEQVIRMAVVPVLAVHADERAADGATDVASPALASA